MENDWQKLGDVVRRIVARTEGAIIDRTPIPQADVAMFVSLLTGEIHDAPAKQGAARRKEGQAK